RGRPGRRPRRAVELHLARSRLLDHVGELDLLRREADTDPVEALLPQLVVLARERLGRRPERDRERLAVGVGPEAACAALVSEIVEELVRKRGVVPRVVAITRVVADDPGRNRRLGLNRLAFADDADLVVD